MSERLDKAFYAANFKTPVKVCRACGFPVVGFMANPSCPRCNKEVVTHNGITAPWDKARPWAPTGTLVGVSERTL